uniref:Uncharacterized protein n=1 Tax=Oryza brachyantha TaxID=4533 RepID=J3M7R2_ORYBR
MVERGEVATGDEHRKLYGHSGMDWRKDFILFSGFYGDRCIILISYVNYKY